MAKKKDKHQHKTNAVRIVEAAGIPYEMHEYEAPEGFLDGVSVAKALGQEPGSVFKTLVTVGQSREYYVCEIPVDKELDLKKAAKHFGEKKLEMLPIECIVRGYITGSGWKSYQENGTVCGIKLPEGLKESDKLPEPIYTPSTKAEIGDHDENISYEQSIAHLEKYFPGKGEEYAAKLRDCTIALYKKCADYALSRGIIIADTKFEFGLDENGNMVIGDEMLTPDSSRFWPVEGYEPGHGQPSFDKQFARDWLTSHPDNDWNLPDDIVQKTIDKYLQCYKMITGEELA